MARMLRAVFVVLAAGYAALVGWAATALPERVPAHWGTGSGPTRWGSRGEAITNLIILGVVMVGVFAGIWLLAAKSRQLTGLNIPNREYWTAPERLAESRAKLSVDVGVMGCLAVAWACTVPVSIVRATAAPDHALPALFSVALIAFLVLLAAYLVWMIAVRWRVPPADRAAAGR